MTVFQAARPTQVPTPDSESLECCSGANEALAAVSWQEAVESTRAASLQTAVEEDLSARKCWERCTRIAIATTTPRGATVRSGIVWHWRGEPCHMQALDVRSDIVLLTMPKKQGGTIPVRQSVFPMAWWYPSHDDWRVRNVKTTAWDGR